MHVSITLIFLAIPWQRSAASFRHKTIPKSTNNPLIFEAVILSNARTTTVQIKKESIAEGLDLGGRGVWNSLISKNLAH